MKRIAFSLVCLVLIAVSGVSAQEDESQILQLHLKSGEILEGELRSVDEDGVKLDIGDGIELFIRWSYTRGDKHYELRKEQTDFQKFESVMNLADFCHEFAMDEQESYVLVAALKLDPKNEEVRERLDELPEVEGLKIPGEDGETETEPEPTEPENPKSDLPPPTRATFKVWIDMESDDDATETWLVEQFEDMNYKTGTEDDHEIRVEIEVEFELIKNPKFMGAELYAIYNGELTYKAYRKGEKSAFATDTVKAEDVRRDSKDEARTRCRKDLLEEAFPELYNEIEKLR